ncbi:MAG: hypothetical protein ISS34_00705 [Candidatus Omnitrophica bacterium]|nr:hypothetical protein [Candidatus Omnitrophota bacterium]
MKKMRGANHAFTIIELMMTIVLFVILTVVSIFLFRTILLSWSSQETRAGIDIDIDFAVENMVRDLREAQIVGFANADEIRFTQGLNDDTNNYIYYLYDSSDSYPPDFDQDTYQLRKAGLTGVSGRDLSTGTFTYGEGDIITTDVISPNDADDPSDLSFRVPEAFYYVLHAGNLYTGDDITFQGSSGTITGDLSASDKVSQESGMTINGTIYEMGDSNTTLPIVGLSYYGSIADYSYTTNQTFSADPAAGIHYIDGNVTITSNVTIDNATIIATEGITLRNATGLTVSPAYPYPALVAGSSINASGAEGTINGLVYAAGNVDLDQANIILNGTMVAGGTITMTDGTFTCTYDSDIQSVSPPYFYYSTITLDLCVESDDEKIESSTKVRPRL